MGIGRVEIEALKNNVARIVLAAIALLLFLKGPLEAGQSVITESEGYACMGEDKSRKATEQAAVADAKRNAAEGVKTYIESETKVKDFELEKDIVSAYANAEVKIVGEPEKSWYKDPGMGDCFRVKIKAEVTPDEKALAKASKKDSGLDDPSAPLSVKVWVDKAEYMLGEKIKIYVKGNKPFFARVVYKDASGKLLQLLPNPYRKDNYFNGGTVYEIPSGGDNFDLEVSPPFGKESVTVYASTSELGEIELSPLGGVYDINTKPSEVGARTRGVTLKHKEKGSSAAEFSEAGAGLKTK